MLILGVIGAIVGLVCWLIILVDAFQDEIWKGLLGLICGLYLLYYAIVEFEHANKWPIVLGYLLGSALSGIGFRSLGL
ncbi:MAG: hypothetical protein ABIV13_00690 [Fimbriimonadales bacterium]